MGRGLKALAQGAETRHCMVRRVAGWGICTALVMGAFLPGPAAAAPHKQLRWQVLGSVTPPRCTAHTGCSSVYPRRGRLLRLHAPRLVGCVAGGPSLVLSGPSSRREIALTFDDGPWNDPPTADFLNVL